MTSRPNTDALAYARSWPGVLPLNEAAVVLGTKPDALRLRWWRGKQPGYKQGRRLLILLTPSQWADWSLTSDPACTVTIDRTGESPLHHSPTPATEHPATTPTTGQEGVLVLLAQLEAARRREVELAGMVGFLQRRVQELEERPVFAHQPVRSLEPGTEQRTLPAPAWWRRALSWIASPSTPPASLAPGPSQNR